MTKKILFGTFLLAFAIGMGFSSCTKDDNNSTNPDVTDTTNTGGGNDIPSDTTGSGNNNNLLPTTFPDKHIKKITIVRQGQMDTLAIVDYSWNGNLLSEILVNDKNTVNSSNFTTNNIQFDYSNGKVTNTTIIRDYGSNNPIEMNYHYVYNNNGLIESQTYIPTYLGEGAGDQTIYYTYNYQENGTISISSNGNRNPIFYWNNGNVTKIKNWQQNTPDIPFAYDNKKNPLCFPLGIECWYVPFFRIYWLNFPIWSSNNFTNMQGNRLTCSYSYSSDGWPISAVMTDTDGSEVEHYDITFEYYN